MRILSRWFPALAVLAGLAMSVPSRAADVQVNITADNAYAFGFGSEDEIESFFGGVQNCKSSHILQPEQYTISNAAPEDYLYVLGWSDDSSNQGVLGEFSTDAGRTYTGVGNWEVFATGVDLDPPSGGNCITGPAANTPSLSSIKAQIAIANQSAGNTSTTSGGWVGLTGGSGVGAIAFGEANDLDSGVFPLVPGINSQARWMWYDRAPAPNQNPFSNSTNHKEYLIFRLPLAQVPGVDSCLHTIGESALCAADGTGDFLYTLTFRNKSDKAVHNLFFVDPQDLTDPTRAVSIVPDSVSFAANPVPPSGIRTVKLRIKGAKPQDKVQFFVSLQDDLEECCQGCQILKTIDLPPCSCAQVTGGGNIQCRLLNSTSYSYSLELQSLIPDPIHYLLLAPASGSKGTFTPGSIKLTPPLGQFQKRSFSTSLSNATPGANLCTQIGLFGQGFKDCCVFEECSTVPRCEIRLENINTLGHSTIRPIDEGLLIEGFDDSGEDGVSIDTGKALAWDGEWLPVPDSVPTGALLRNAFQGEVEGASGTTVAVLEARKTAAGVELRTDLSGVGATTQRIELLNDGVLVGTETGHGNAQPFYAPNAGIHTDAHFVLLDFVSASEENGTPCNPSEPNLRPCLFAGYTFKAGVNFLQIGDVDEIRFYPEDAALEVTALENVTIQAAGIPSLTLTHTNVALDCNKNGLPDAEDIAGGSSADLDPNGIPDECEGSDLELSLNTGFDQASGETPSGGAVDGDWQVVNAIPPGPARVVVDPYEEWQTPFPSSRWISVDPVEGASVPGRPVLHFENCFCISGLATSAELDVEIRADDFARVLLNGLPVGAAGGEFWNPSPLRAQLTGAVGEAGPFKPGQNCVRVEVHDSGGIITGLDLAGTVRAGNGRCSN